MTDSTLRADEVRPPRRKGARGLPDRFPDRPEVIQKIPTQLGLWPADSHGPLSAWVVGCSRGMLQCGGPA